MSPLQENHQKSLMGTVWQRLPWLQLPHVMTSTAGDLEKLRPSD